MAAQDLQLRLTISADGSVAVRGVQDVADSVENLGQTSRDSAQDLQEITNTLLSADIAADIVGAVTFQPVFYWLNTTGDSALDPLQVPVLRFWVL